MDNVKYANSLNSLINDKNNEFSVDDMKDALTMCQEIILSLHKKNTDLMNGINEALSICEGI